MTIMCGRKQSGEIKGIAYVIGSCTSQVFANHLYDSKNWDQAAEKEQLTSFAIMASKFLIWGRTACLTANLAAGLAASVGL